MADSAASYGARPVTALPPREIAGWSLKRYVLLAPGRTSSPETIEAAVEAAGRVLPGHSGAPPERLGFQIVHIGEHAVWAPTYWWVHGDSLAGGVLRAPLDTPALFEPVDRSLIGCVWELGIVEFERRAWIATMMAGGDGSGARTAYLSRCFEGDV